MVSVAAIIRNGVLTASKESITTAIILLGSIYLILDTFRTWYRLKHIPGPWHAGISRFWMLRSQASGRSFRNLGDLVDQYGPLVRIGPGTVVTSDPAVIRRIWAVRSPYVRSGWYDGMRLDPPKDNILSMRGPGHTELKAKLIAGYSGKDIDNLESSIDDGVAKLVHLIESKYISSNSEYHPMDFALKAQFFTLDVLSEIAFGEAFGYLTKDKDLYDYIKTTEESLPILFIANVIPLFKMILHSPLMKRFMPHDQDPIGFGKIRGIGKALVAKRFGPDKVTRRDMLGSFVAHGLSQVELERESILQIIAGSDTTATAIRSTMLQLITSPRCYEKLQAEIDSAIQRGEISSPITDVEGKNLPYLQACIKEGIRLWPPINGIMPKVSESDDIILGTHIPSGTEVGWCAWRVFRNTDVFGSDAEVFNPERWFEKDEDKLKEMENTADLAFSPGRWKCLGQAIAFIELNKVFVALLRRFNFELVNPTNPWTIYNTGLLIQKNMILKVSKR